MKSLWMNETRLNHLLKVVELCIDADSSREVSDTMYEVADYCENH